MIRPGDAAMDFVLKDHRGRDVRLSEFSGQNILLWFHSSIAPGTMPWARQLAKRVGKFEELATHLIGVSLQQPPSDLCLDHPNWTMLRDPEGHVHDLYETWRTTVLGRRRLAAKRFAVLIDSDGIIREVYRGIRPRLHPPLALRDVRRIHSRNEWKHAVKKRVQLRKTKDR